MTLIFYEISFLCTVCTGWVSSIPVSMSGISVKNSWPNCSPGHRLHIIFDLVLEAKIAVPAVSPHLTLYRLGWNSYFGLQYEVKIDICINSAPLPPTKKGGFCLPAHAWCLLVSSA